MSLQGDRSSVFVVVDAHGVPLKKDHVVHSTCRLMKALGLEGKSFHSWRHTFGFWAADALPIHKLKAVLGHSSIRVTEMYCKAEVEDMAGEIRKRLAEGHHDIAKTSGLRD